MRAQNNNIKAVPPSSTSLNHHSIQINTLKNINEFRAFLYSEVKRQSTRPVNIDDINHFINSPEGQKGLALFISNRMTPTEITRPKAFGDILKTKF